MKLSLITAIAGGLILTSCISIEQTTREVKPASSMASEAMPKAFVYCTNGDYADYVPVTLNDSRTKIVSWPAPTDITKSQRPIKYAGGWMLDRRGINSNTAFLDYTYSEYAKLPATIGPEQLMSHIIPEARVTEIRLLPIPLWKAVDDPVEASKLVGKAQVVYSGN